MKKIFPKQPSIVYHQAPNLKQRLTKSRLRELPFQNMEDVVEEVPGCFRFEHQGRGRSCETCPILCVSHQFTSNYTRRTYKMRHRLNCKSNFVIYLVSCQKPGCLSQYVGSTTKTMMERHRGHRQEIRDRSSPLGQHFSECRYRSFSLQIIDCVREGEEDGLRRAEGFWQHNLACFAETGGINRRDKLTRARKN